MYGIHFNKESIQKLIDQKLFSKEDWEADGYTIFDELDFQYEFMEAGNLYTDQFKLYLIVGNSYEDAYLKLGDCLNYLKGLGLNFTIKDVAKIGGTIG